jgi:hypothetical protein
MPKRKLFLILLTVTLIVIIYGLYKIATFELFDEEPIFLKSINVPNKDYRLKIYHFPSNAVTQPSIYVTKAEGKTEEFLIAYDRFDSLINHYLFVDSIYFVMGYSTVGSIDTLPLKIP